MDVTLLYSSDIGRSYTDTPRPHVITASEVLVFVRGLSFHEHGPIVHAVHLNMLVNQELIVNGIDMRYYSLI